MKAGGALRVFEKMLLGKGKELSQLRLGESVAAYLEFYRTVRAEDCDVEADGDMLLYQWGNYSFDDRPEFMVDLTRQFIVGDQKDPGEDDVGEQGGESNIWQLVLTFHYSASGLEGPVQDGRKWCSTPEGEGVELFEKFILESEAYGAVVRLRPFEVELCFENCG